jgi:haloacetate dehalogenase
MMDQFPAATISTGDTEIFVRTGGRGPPLLLLHGFPETHLMWRDVARQLIDDFTVVCADLCGYVRRDAMLAPLCFVSPPPVTRS